MKATELMIGDWVKIGDADKYHGYFGKVRAINSISGYCIVGIMIGEDIFTQTDVFIDDIELILLTSEILEKNGLERRGSWDMHLLTEDYNILWRTYTKPTAHLTIESMARRIGNFRSYNCNNVHELQHVLRLCGLNELADNFQM